MRLSARVPWKSKGMKQSWPRSRLPKTIPCAIFGPPWTKKSKNVNKNWLLLNSSCTECRRSATGFGDHVMIRLPRSRHKSKVSAIIMRYAGMSQFDAATVDPC